MSYGNRGPPGSGMTLLTQASWESWTVESLKCQKRMEVSALWGLGVAWNEKVALQGRAGPGTNSSVE